MISAEQSDGGDGVSPPSTEAMPGEGFSSVKDCREVCKRTELNLAVRKSLATFSKVI